MKIGYLGDGSWAHRALEKILDVQSWHVTFICARHAAPDPVLRHHASERAIPFYFPREINAPETVASLAAHRPDVIVSMSYDQIMRQALIALPRLGVVNCHAGALPFYRGRNVLNWAIINGEPKFGVTVHYVDDGIDTGDIIQQQFVPIALTDDYGDVLASAHQACAETLCSALRLIEAGTAPRIPQRSIHPVGFYCGRRVAGDEFIDWSWPADRVHNFVRGIAPPGPGARSFVGARQLAILKSELIAGAPAYIGTAGEVVGRDQGGIVVKCGDATLRLLRIAEIERDGRLSDEAVPGLRVGTRFRLRPDAACLDAP